MKAWAVLLGSKSWNRIYCVFADTEPEAMGKAFSELANNIAKDEEDKGQLSDYKVIVCSYAELPSKDGSSRSVPSGSSFDDQIQGARR